MFVYLRLHKRKLFVCNCTKKPQDMLQSAYPAGYASIHPAHKTQETGSVRHKPASSRDASHTTSSFPRRRGEHHGQPGIGAGSPSTAHSEEVSQILQTTGGRPCVIYGILETVYSTCLLIREIIPCFSMEMSPCMFYNHI